MNSTDSDDDAIREGNPPYHPRPAHDGAEPPKRSKWSASLYEAVACALALLGVVMFGFGIFPCVNPIQWRFNFGPEYLPASVVSLVASILVMWIAWRLSREGQRLKQEEKERP